MRDSNVSCSSAQGQEQQSLDRVRRADNNNNNNNNDDDAKEEDLTVLGAEDHNILVPVGATGELVVEGPIVTKGYLHDPDRTAKVFIDAPTWLQKLQDRGRPSGHLYKTGDLVFYNPDGTLNFVGRKDTQVKVRGQRVELSEVEHHIQKQLLSQAGKRVDPVVDLITAGGAAGPSNSGRISRFESSRNRRTGRSAKATTDDVEPDKGSQQVSTQNYPAVHDSISIHTHLDLPS